MLTLPRIICVSADLPLIVYVLYAHMHALELITISMLATNFACVPREEDSH